MTPSALQAIEQARATAHELGHDYWGTEHLLIGLATVDGAAARVLAALGYSADQFRRNLSFLVGEDGDGNPEELLRSPRVERVLIGAQTECTKRAESIVSTLHLLFALLKERQGIAVMLLETPGVGLERIGGRMDQAFRDSLKDE